MSGPLRKGRSVRAHSRETNRTADTASRSLWQSGEPQWPGDRTSASRPHSAAFFARNDAPRIGERAGAARRKVAMSVAVCRAVIRSSASLRTPRGERRGQGCARSSMTYRPTGRACRARVVGSRDPQSSHACPAAAWPLGTSPSPERASARNVVRYATAQRELPNNGAHSRW
jgi:hypothetical protein